ncbi:rab11 family-interacting protein 3 isoform X2 [Nycticebus coucang]|uniref:rab11 family-interacting protein 3 isoform X2 n=1 Tax=Nycticebus coucang TaxID=9470 RepID=UPI00234D3D45|nr:rab11 family-interacting protein 3 isoform X2 [Nycticebus coucang]
MESGRPALPRGPEPRGHCSRTEPPEPRAGGPDGLEAAEQTPGPSELHLGAPAAGAEPPECDDLVPESGADSKARRCAEPAPGLEERPQDSGPPAPPPCTSPGPRGLDADSDLPSPGASGLLPNQGVCPNADPLPVLQLPELDPFFSWTEEPEDYAPASRQESLSFRVQVSSHCYQVRGEVDFFPSFQSPSVGEPALELGPGHPCQPSDFSQTHPLPSEPAGGQEDGSRLRAVFDALDGDGDGFVRIEDFVQFATVYGAEQVKDLTKYLDPSGLGVISFEDFYQGIAAIRNGGPDGQPYSSIAPDQDEEPLACPDEFDDFVTYEANEVTDSAYMGSESTYSECETFTDEDTSTLVHPELQPEGDADSAGGSAVPSECLDVMEEPDHGAVLLLPGRSNPRGQSVVTVIGGEEHFEDYGEGSETELSAETPCSGQLSCSSSAFLTPSPAKRLSSKKVARYLHQSGALTMEALEDPPTELVECPEEDIADKVVFLERRVLELEKDTAATGEQHSRLRQENLQLVHRANALEEQLKEQELRACEVVLEETRRQKELLCKMEREKSIEIENLQVRLQQLDEENSELRSCTPCLKANIERLEEEKQKLLDEIEELTLRLSEEQANKRKMGDRLSQERHQFQRDKEATQELIEDLRKQLEHLQLFKLEAEQRRGRSSSMGLQEYHSRARESELEQEVRRLKQDNRSLKEQNEELNGQIITLSIQGAKSLFSTAFSESLAAEISSVSRDELMEAIQKQEEINFRLQDYIDRIIVAIMETNPSILEVK